jgi:predicted DNA-binding transcriptional regulator AlpA
MPICTVWEDERLRLLEQLDKVRQSKAAEQYMCSSNELAALLGVSPSQIRNALSKRTLKIPVQRHGRSVRFRLSDVIAYQNASVVNA